MPRKDHIWTKKDEWGSVGRVGSSTAPAQIYIIGVKGILIALSDDNANIKKAHAIVEKDGKFTDLWLFLPLTVGLLQMNERSFFSLLSVLQHADTQSLLYGSEISPTRTKHGRQFKISHSPDNGKQSRKRPGLVRRLVEETG